MQQENQEHFTKQITETVPEYFFIYDLEKRKVIYLTDSFRKFIFKKGGSALEQIRYTIHNDYLPAFDKIFEELAKNNFRQDEELRVKEHDNVKWINITTHAIGLGKVEKIACHVLDTTHKNKVLQDLESEVENLEDIIHVLAHDLRGPIGNIMNILEIQREALKDQNINDAISYNEFADRITKQLDSTIKSLIELVELRSNRFELDKSNTIINELIHSVVDNYALDVVNKNITIERHIPEDEISVLIDPVKFHLVLQNVISNAIKFTNEKGRIEVALKELDKHFIVIVSDHGIGIPSDQLENVFKKFTKFKRKGLRGEKSVGLGLSISKKIVELHNGHIEVESEEGKGSTFTIKVPMNQNS